MSQKQDKQVARFRHSTTPVSMLLYVRKYYSFAYNQVLTSDYRQPDTYVSVDPFIPSLAVSLNNIFPPLSTRRTQISQLTSNPPRLYRNRDYTQHQNQPQVKRNLNVGFMGSASGRTPQVSDPPKFVSYMSVATHRTDDNDLLPATYDDSMFLFPFAIADFYSFTLWNSRNHGRY